MSIIWYKFWNKYGGPDTQYAELSVGTATDSAQIQEMINDDIAEYMHANHRESWNVHTQIVSAPPDEWLEREIQGALNAASHYMQRAHELRQLLGVAENTAAAAAAAERAAVLALVDEALSGAVAPAELDEVESPSAPLRFDYAAVYTEDDEGASLFESSLLKQRWLAQAKATFALDSRVRVCHLDDDDDPTLLRKEGTVTGYDVGHAGQWPLIVVEFGTRGAHAFDAANLCRA